MARIWRSRRQCILYDGVTHAPFQFGHWLWLASSQCGLVTLWRSAELKREYDMRHSDAVVFDYDVLEDDGLVEGPVTCVACLAEGA